MNHCKTIVVTGTDTDVGKTTISAALCYALEQAGLTAAYYKPALSGAFRTDKTDFASSKLIAGDLELVSAVAGLSKPHQYHCSYLFEEAVSPHLAAQVNNVEIDKDVILEDLHRMETENPSLIVEGAGGAACPLRVDFEQKVYTFADLMADMKRPAVVVCRAKLGTLHHTTATVAYLRQFDIPILGLIVNGYEEDWVCKDNLTMLQTMTGLPILATFPKLDDAIDGIDAIRTAVDENWDCTALIRRLFE